MGSEKKLLIIVLALQPIILVAALTFYRYGIREMGEPSEYHRRQEEIYRTLQDSIAAQMRVMTPENIGDSTMVGMEMHTNIFTETQRYEQQMDTVLTALDSLKSERETLEAMSEDVTRRQQIYNDLTARAIDEKIVELAKIYDGMKPPQSVPLFMAMDDTLAVLIITNMQNRNASKLLGAIAESDIDKATRITKLLAMMGIVKLD